MKTYAQGTKTIKKAKVIKFFIISLIFVSIAGAIAIIGFNYIGNRNFRETFHSASSMKVNNKIRIIQISDLHNCSYGKNNAKLIDRIGKLKPDLIIYTGDVIDSDTESVDAVVELCRATSEIAPSFYIYGNNEVEKYYDMKLTQEELDEKFQFDDDTRDASSLSLLNDELEEKLEKAGVRVLKNEVETVIVDKTTVDVYGVFTSNPSAFWSYGGEAFDKYIFSNKNNFKITAIHEPNVFEVYTPDFWGDLMLAGHTHGGLVKIPLVGPLYTHDAGLLPARGGHYVFGRYDVAGRPLIVSSGLENKSIIRINNSPELVIIDVNKF